jgi:hypothetical protein
LKNQAYPLPGKREETKNERWKTEEGLVQENGGASGENPSV